MTSEELLQTPVGRRAVEAMRVAGYYSSNERRLRAALKVLQSDICQTCGGSGKVGKVGMLIDVINGIECPNPDCDSGRVKPALYTQEQVEKFAHRYAFEALREHRAEVIEGVVERLREEPKGTYSFHAADDIERWEHEQNG